MKIILFNTKTGEANPFDLAIDDSIILFSDREQSIDEIEIEPNEGDYGAVVTRKLSDTPALVLHAGGKIDVRGSINRTIKWDGETCRVENLSQEKEEEQ